MHSTSMQTRAARGRGAWLTPRWVGRLGPLVIFVVLASMVGGLAVWQQRQHEADLERQTRLAAEQLAEKLREVIETRLELVSALRDDYESGRLAGDDALRTVAAHQIRSFPGLLAINWVQPSGVIRWVTPEEPNLDARGRNVLESEDAAPVFLRARGDRVDQVTPAIILFQGDWGFASYFPVVRDGELDGFLNGVIRFRELLDEVVDDGLRTSFELALHGDDLLVAGGLPEDSDRGSRVVTSRVPFDAGGRPFELVLAPGESMRRRGGPSAGPLALALLLAAFLSLATRQALIRGAEVRGQRQLLRRLVASLPVSAFRLDRHGALVDSLAGGDGDGANGAGASGSAVAGPGAAALLAAAGTRVDRALRGQPTRFEISGGEHDGAPWTCELFLYPEAAGSGVLGFAIDISDRKQAEDALRRSEERYRRFYRGAPFAFLSIDRDGVVELANAQAAALTGRSDESLLGTAFLDLCAPSEDGVERAAELLESAARGERVRNVDIHLRRPDGSSTWGSLSLQAVVDDDDTVRGCRVIVVDVSKRKQLEERMRQAQKMEAIGRLAGGIAHDFNNLLTAIMGYARMASIRLPAESPARGDLGEIESAGRRAARLVAQLLAFARRQVVEPKVLEVDPLVRDMDPMLRRLVREEVRVFTDLRAAGARVRIDPSQLEQVIVNLVVNAMEAIDGAGLIRVETLVSGEPTVGADADDDRTGEEVVLRVDDTGSGMSAEVLEHLFEPFFTTKDDTSGTGLGLATVYGIVDGAGGDVRVTSRPGEGTSITVALPRVEAPVSHVGTARSRTPPPRGDARVLLVEDEEMVRALARDMLEDLGYSVLSAVDGVDALEQVDGRESEFDLLFSDVVMPRLGGDELCRMLRRGHPELRVVLTSGYTESASIQAEIEHGGVVFLHKPYTLDELARAVRGALDGSAPRSGGAAGRVSV